MNKLLLATGALSLLAAVPALAQAMTPRQYVSAAGASDLYEREASQLVLASTQNPKLRAFAKTMIAQHTESTTMVKKAAMASGLKVAPPMLMPEQAKMIAQLKAEHGMERDKTYVMQQKMAHEKALAVQKDYAEHGSDKPLRMAAGKIVPVVEHHIAMLNMM